MDQILRAGGLVIHLAAAVIAFGLLTLSPPARGRMLLVSLFGTGSGAALQIALRNGGGLVGRGPFAGSLIVSGELSRLAAPLRAAGIVLLAAPRGCGEAKS